MAHIKARVIFKSHSVWMLAEKSISNPPPPPPPPPKKKQTKKHRFENIIWSSGS